MKWTKLTLETTAEAEDLVSNMLNDLGISSIEISDNIPLSEEDRKKLFIDFLPKMNEQDHTAFVSFYVNVEENLEALLINVKEGLKELSEFVEVGTGIITVSETEDLDWINNWKEFFKPFYVYDNILIKPTWEELPEVKEDDLVIEIDPGISFGTGSHETTKLAIIGLKKHMQEDSVILDAGSGSGILSIIAKKLGAKEVLGIDIDPIATEAALLNAEVNKMEIAKGNLSFHTGNIIEDDGIRSLIGRNKYDIVVANILADVIIPLSDVISENLKPGGIFISSGIINTKEKDVEEALLKNNFAIIEVNRMNDWVSFVAEK
jgi:ribosomal protein L11 methyltransferase